jgi:hypothetical protein
LFEKRKIRKINIIKIRNNFNALEKKILEVKITFLITA